MSHDEHREENGPGRPRKGVTIDVDGEDVTVPDRDVTPNEILALAGLDPATHYLVHIKAKHQEPFKGIGDQPIKVHEGEKFVSLSTGPTPTS